MRADDPPASDPLASTELTFLLGMSFQTLLAEFVRRVSALGYADLRPVHGMALQALRGGSTATELAHALGMTKQAAGQLVDDLDRRGYVRREPHPAGGRRRLIVLTPAAHEHLRAAGRVLHDLESEVATELGEDAMIRLRADAARLVRTLSGDTLPPLRPVW